MRTVRITIGSEEWNRILSEGAATLGIKLEDRQIRLMALHATELLKWNRRVNLTRITEPVEVAVKHFLDSMAAAPLIGAEKTVLDLGSGGGFPGLPLKVAVPDARVTLVDSARKKVSFLKHVIRQIGLEGVDALQSRVESLGGHPAHRGKYDVVVSRALASLDDFVRLAMPLVASRGVIVALKAGRAADEIRELAARCRKGERQAPIRLVEAKEMILPVMNLRRCIVVLKPAASPPTACL